MGYLHSTAVVHWEEAGVRLASSPYYTSGVMTHLLGEAEAGQVLTFDLSGYGADVSVQVVDQSQLAAGVQFLDNKATKHKSISVCRKKPPTYFSNFGQRTIALCR